MNERTYKIIKSKIRQSIVLNNGYQYDDLCHDTIEKLLKTKKSNESCEKMCVTVALNLIKSHHRKKITKELYIARKIHESSNVYEMKEVSDQIKIIIPIKYKRLFILRYKFKMKYKEIKDYLDIPMGTLKTKIYFMNAELKELNT